MLPKYKCCTYKLLSSLVNNPAMLKEPGSFILFNWPQPIQSARESYVAACKICSVWGEFHHVILKDFLFIYVWVSSVGSSSEANQLNKCIIYQGHCKIAHACPVCNLIQQSEDRASHEDNRQVANLWIKMKVEIKIEAWPERRWSMQKLFLPGHSQEHWLRILTNKLWCCEGNGKLVHGWMSRPGQDKQKQQLRHDLSSSVVPLKTYHSNDHSSFFKTTLGWVQTV